MFFWIIYHNRNCLIGIGRKSYWEIPGSETMSVFVFKSMAVHKQHFQTKFQEQNEQLYAF